MKLCGETLNENFEEIIKTYTREEFNKKFFVNEDEDSDAGGDLCTHDNNARIGCPFYGGDCHGGDDDDCVKCWEEFIKAARFKDEHIVTTIRNEAGLLVNEITKYLDSHLQKDRLVNNVFCNYIYDNPVEEQYLIRYPGATRGAIKVNSDNIIIAIKIGTDGHIYDTDVYEGLLSFIGRKFAFV